LKTNFLRNKKGVAEIIGTLLFIIILLFFFTNVYLWHDSATKQMDDLYVQKLNSPITVYAYQAQSGATILNVTNRGGVDTTLSMVWVALKPSNGGPDLSHTPYAVSGLLGAQAVLPAGSSEEFQSPVQAYQKVLFTVVSTVGNTASCSYTRVP
jgi:hypothetical protein